MLDFTTAVLHDLTCYVLGTVYPHENTLVSTTRDIYVLVLEHFENHVKIPGITVQKLKLNPAQLQMISEAWPQGLVSQPCWMILRNCEDSDCVVLGFEDSPANHKEIFRKFSEFSG